MGHVIEALGKDCVGRRTLLKDVKEQNIMLKTRMITLASDRGPQSVWNQREQL